MSFTLYFKLLAIFSSYVALPAISLLFSQNSNNTGADVFTVCRVSHSHFVFLVFFTAISLGFNMGSSILIYLPLLNSLFIGIWSANKLFHWVINFRYCIFYFWTYLLVLMFSIHLSKFSSAFQNCFEHIKADLILLSVDVFTVFLFCITSLVFLSLCHLLMWLISF